MKWCYIYSIFLLITNCVCTFGQTIKILPYRQEDSVTNCTHGLVSDIDTVVFKAEVDYTKDSKISYYYFQRKATKDSDFIILEGTFFNGSFTLKRDWDLIRPYVVRIPIRIKAMKKLSGAIIRGVVISSTSMELISNEHIFPDIKDSTDIKSRLFINGVAVIIENTHVIYAEGPAIIVVFQCDGQVLPCLIEISATDMMVPMLGKGFVIHTSRKEELNITIKYGACTLNGKPKIISFCIKLVDAVDYKSTLEETQVHVFTSGIVNILLLILIVVLVIVIIMNKIRILFKKLKFKRVIKSGDALDGGIEMSLLNKPSDNLDINPSKNLMDCRCDRNPGHHKFYALSNFKLSNVHKEYQDEDILTLIRCIAHLTTRVCVGYTSEHRPTTEQDINGMILNYIVKDMNAPRYKTGMVIHVENCSDDGSKCPCEICTEKCESSTSWGKVFVLTASTVVFDNSEAKKSSFDLFYGYDSSEVCTLQGRCVSEIDLSKGWCVVECVTCDLNLLDRLIRMINKCKDQMNIVNSKYISPKHTHKLTFIVSHPHGFPINVTVGYWKDRVIVPKDRCNEHTRYEYTTRTCTGSAGAFVYIIGVSDISRKCYHVHISSKAENCNYSSIGVEKAPGNVHS